MNFSDKWLPQNVTKINDETQYKNWYTNPSMVQLAWKKNVKILVIKTENQIHYINSYLYSRVRHFFFEHRLHKILIRRAFYSPRPRDSKTGFILFLRLIFLKYFEFGIPDVNCKVFFLLSNIDVWRIKRRVSEHWTQI